MRILWGALRAVSVEMMGVLVVLWMLHGATGLALDPPWRATESLVAAEESADDPNTQVANAEPASTPDTATDLALEKTARDETERATVGQWFNTLFPASVHKTPASPPTEYRAEFTRERLDHYSRLYGIASRD